jgi:hypothetical protein
MHRKLCVLWRAARVLPVRVNVRVLSVERMQAGGRARATYSTPRRSCHRVGDGRRGGSGDFVVVASLVRSLSPSFARRSHTGDRRTSARPPSRGATARAAAVVAAASARGLGRRVHGSCV